MEYFNEQGLSHQEVEALVRRKYGENAKIMTRRTVKIGGFLGLFAKEGIEVSGFVSPVKDFPGKSNFEEERKKILNAAKEQTGPTLQDVLNEVRNIQKTIPEPAPAGRSEHETVERLQELLAKNEFSFSYIQKIIKKVKADFSLEELDNYSLVQSAVVDWIGEDISVVDVKLQEKPELFVLVGPTGVGKTTTIAKLAAMFGVQSVQSLDVRMITIDNYRIGAKHQIETYGEIMNIPVTGVETFDDLKKHLALASESDLVFIDTIGKSPKDRMKLAEMRDLLDACGSGGKFHLAMSSTTKYSDMIDLMQQFEIFGYDSVVITKLDETSRVGNLISALHEKGKPLSFITDGQRVPQDIERASIVKLLTHLEGFTINRERIERKFASAIKRS